MTKKPSVIAIFETWLDDQNTKYYNLSGYSSYHLVRTERVHGGVSLYISDKLISSQVKSLSYISDIIEILTAKFSIDQESYTICSIYRPDSKDKNVDKFTNELLTILNDNNIKNDKIILIGDMNINLLEHSSDQPTNEYLNALQTISFHPHITKPTRFPDQNQKGSPSLLDHLFTNFFYKSIPGILHYPVSDHLPVFISLDCDKSIPQIHEITTRTINDRNKSLFTRKLNEIDWENMLSSNDLNINFSIFNFNSINEMF